MSAPEWILAILGVAVAAAGITAYYKRSEGQETISLLKTRRDALIEENTALKNRVTYLQGVVDEKDRIISKLSK